MGTLHQVRANEWIWEQALDRLSLAGRLYPKENDAVTLAQVLCDLGQALQTETSARAIELTQVAIEQLVNLILSQFEDEKELHMWTWVLEPMQKISKLDISELGHGGESSRASQVTAP